MPIQYEPKKYAFFTEGDSLTEQEHADSCDINKMIHAAKRGLNVRGGADPVYGYDDTTIDAVQHRIKKQQAEDSLRAIAKQQEFTEEELNQMKLHPETQKKLGFKIKKHGAKKPEAKTNELNDQKTPPVPAPTETTQKPNS